MKIFCALCALFFSFLAYTQSPYFIDSPFDSGWAYGWLITYGMTAFSALISCIKPFPSWCYFCGSILAFIQGVLRLLNDTTQSIIPLDLANYEITGPFLVATFFITLSLAKWKKKPVA